ncbi:P22 phage major capsid protein family protein, partial [Escherichia coli]|uniref:P22 phage major capsid protein family protein n=1 Tax=Escherichia coli TaxID=562 RepID=UPI002572DD73
PSGKNIIRWLLKKRTNGSVRYCQYTSNLFYNKFFCGLGSIPLPKLHSIDSAVATYEGFSIRVHKYADGDANVQKMRFDLLPAYVCFNPHMGGQFFGNP